MLTNCIYPYLVIYNSNVNITIQKTQNKQLNKNIDLHITNIM